MKCSIVKGLIAGVLVSVTFFSCSRHGVQQTKNYKQILYGNVTGEQQSLAEQPTIIHSTNDKNVGLLLVDTVLLTQRTVSIFTDAALSTKVTNKVAEFYRLNELKTKWLNTTEPSTLYYALIANLKSAEAYGLNSDDYNPTNLEKAVASVYTETPNEKEVVALDVRISEIYFLFTTHLSEGKVRKTGYSNYVWLREENLAKHSEDVKLLAATQTSKDLTTVFDQIQPGNQNYRNLKIALEHYRDLERYAAVESLPVISLNGKVEPGSKNKVVPLIRKRLSQFDLKIYPLVMDTTTGVWDSLQYDKGLVQGIVAFQIIHGLEPDGIIGAKTITFLNQNLKDRVGAIMVNMDRIRWTPEITTDREYIVVNVPEYKLRIYDKEKQVFDMRVIVGALENPTPIFNDYVKNVVFSPTWTVPVSIIQKEIIPRLQSNPTYYTQRNYVFYKNGEEIDPSTEAWGTTQAHEYRIVQQSGGDNSLGRVKFGMTNAMRIYLHDTPAQKLFSKDFRALSHGCVRLDEPAKFAEYLLRDNNGWDKERIKKQMFEDKASTVVLKKDYPVHIQYCTAWVSDDGVMNFREDIYGHDRMQLQQLNKPAVKASGIIAGL